MSAASYDSYQETGLAWSPSVPVSWRPIPLKLRVLKIGSGKTPLGGAETYVDEGVMFLRSQNIYDEGLVLTDVSHISPSIDEAMSSTRVLRGDVLLNITGGSIGRCCVYDLDAPANVNQHVCIIRLRPGTDCYYVKYLWNSCGKIYIERSQKTGNRESVNFQQIGNAKFAFPPLPEQRAIVAFLDEKCAKIDRLVAAKTKEVELLGEYKQRLIFDAVTRGLDKSVKLRDSGIAWLGQVPEHWEVRKVRSHFRLRSEKVSEAEYPALSVAKQGVVDQLSDIALSMAGGESRKLVRKGDYVVNSRSDRKGACGIAPRDGSVSTISIVLEPFGIDRRYVHHLFRSNGWIEEFYRNGRGIVADLWTTSYQQMRNMSLPVPPADEQRAIVSYIEEKSVKIDGAMANFKAQIERLKEYKQRLIADVVTGQIKVA